MHYYNAAFFSESADKKGDGFLNFHPFPIHEKTLKILAFFPPQDMLTFLGLAAACREDDSK